MKSRTLADDIEHVKENREEYTLRNKLNLELIQAKMGLSRGKANQVKKLIDKEDE